MAIAKTSIEWQRIIAESRLIALHLGCDYISTLHFLVADCQLYPFWSLRDVLFSRPRALATFTESLRAGPPIAAAGSVPLLKECEQALQQLRAVTRRYRAAQVQPCHFFLAASQVPSSQFALLLASNHLDTSNIEQHFARTNQLNSSPAQADPPRLHKMWRWLGG